ncbi:hypothetical protein [Mastigocoleus sp. MO_188.B34]|uniref:hypothetical protein n=1 Tax=Mastigocoleus sp. MO_188.B34 TaxID=3036635 RepID=UPI002628FF38|nr:hypothetical protein [Mastigocoleus sp. MO_188.B34]MDJ0697727.1 hypothetical protein [Mastigocoleus sp. MO_188.B34]
MSNEFNNTSFMKTSIFPTGTLLIISLLMIGCNNAQVGDHDKNNQPVTKNQIDLASKNKEDNSSPANNIKNTNATSKARINNKNNITKDNENEIKDNWRRMTEAEEINQIKLLINSRMGVAALNQVALEGFVGVGCTRKFYLNEPYSGFQTLMRVKCREVRGASIAIGYDEIRIIFNRFEDNIESFDVERVSEETGAPKIKLPD